jgi:hypothetical protein
MVGGRLFGPTLINVEERKLLAAVRAMDLSLGESL